MQVIEAAAGFAALSQETRLSALKALVKAGPEGLSAGALAETLVVPAPNLSFHLKDLAAAGLVQSRREGRNIVYSADYGGVRALIDFLLAECCQGDPRLCGPYIVKEVCR
jgi:DNA-binding transcriptional ArsR family regulator